MIEIIYLFTIFTLSQGQYLNLTGFQFKRYGHATATCASTNSVWFVGGIISKFPTIYTDSIEILNLKTNSITYLKLSIARSELASISDASSNYIMFAGGRDGSREYNVVDIFDCVTLEHVNRTLSVARTNMIGAYVMGNFWFIGGNTINVNQYFTNIDIITRNNNVELSFDVSTMNLASSKRDMSVSVTEQCIIISGGQSYSQTILSTIEYFCYMITPPFWTSLRTSNLLIPRSCHASYASGNINGGFYGAKKIVIFAGGKNNAESVTNTVELFQFDNSFNLVFSKFLTNLSTARAGITSAFFGVKLLDNEDLNYPFIEFSILFTNGYYFQGGEQVFFDKYEKYKISRCSGQSCSDFTSIQNASVSLINLKKTPEYSSITQINNQKQVYQSGSLVTVHTNSLVFTTGGLKYTYNNGIGYYEPANYFDVLSNGCGIVNILYPPLTCVSPYPACYDGNYCEQYSTTPFVCPIGSFCNSKGNLDNSLNLPIKCPSGSYCDLPGLKIGQTCGNGNYCPNEAMTTPIICPVGFYCPKTINNDFSIYGFNTGLTQAVICNGGVEGYCPITGLSFRIPCINGTGCTGETMTICQSNNCQSGLPGVCGTCNLYFSSTNPQFTSVVQVSPPSTSAIIPNVNSAVSSKEIEQKVIDEKGFIIGIFTGVVSTILIGISFKKIFDRISKIKEAGLPLTLKRFFIIDFSIIHNENNFELNKIGP